MTSPPDANVLSTVAFAPMNDDVPKTVTAIIGGSSEGTASGQVSKLQKPPRPTIDHTNSSDSMSAMVTTRLARPASLKDTPRSGSSTPVGTTFKKGKGHIKNKLSTQIPHIPAADSLVPSKDGTNSNVVGDRLRLGICAMDKKARSKPMVSFISFSKANNCVDLKQSISSF